MLLLWGHRQCSDHAQHLLLCGRSKVMRTSQWRRHQWLSLHQQSHVGLPLLCPVEMRCCSAVASGTGQLRQLRVLKRLHSQRRKLLRRARQRLEVLLQGNCQRLLPSSCQSNAPSCHLAQAPACQRAAFQEEALDLRQVVSHPAQHGCAPTSRGHNTCLCDSPRAHNRRLQLLRRSGQ